MTPPNQAELEQMIALALSRIQRGRELIESGELMLGLAQSAAARATPSRNFTDPGDTPTTSADQTHSPRMPR